MRTSIKYFLHNGAQVGVRTFVENGTEMCIIDSKFCDDRPGSIDEPRHEYEDFLTTTWKGVEVKRCRYFKMLGVKPS